MRFLRAIEYFLILAICFTPLATAQKKPLRPGEMILIGKLTQVMGVGGETTGWALELQSDLTLEGQTFRSIEVSGPQKKLTQLANQKVKARGFLKHRQGVERKDWLILEITSIWLKKPTGTT
jgi:hypothetical protein